MNEADEDEPLEDDTGGDNNAETTSTDDAGGEDAFGVEGGGNAGGDNVGGGADASTAPASPNAQDQNIGESSPDERRKKVRYFEEFEKLYGCIEEFTDAISNNGLSTATTNSFVIKNLEYIKMELDNLKEKSGQVLKGGIVKISYTNLIQIFIAIQNSLKELKKLYDFTMKRAEE